jgi:hypothetical protein
VSVIELTRGYQATVDDDDLPFVAGFKWRAQIMPTTVYAVRQEGGRATRRVIYLHGFLTGWPRVDHIDCDGLNNRRSNLRAATQQENLRNTRKRAGTTSQYKGVWLHAPGRWRAAINIDGVKRYLGLYRSETEAAVAYDTAARELFGEFARLNFGR